VRVAPRAIVKRILLAQVLHLRRREVREQGAEYGAKFQADVAAQKFEAGARAARGRENLALRAADIGRGIEQRAVDIEQVNRITRNHRTGLSLPSIARRMILIGGNPCARNLS